MKGELSGNCLVLDRVNNMQEHKQSPLVILNDRHTENTYMDVVVTMSSKRWFYFTDKNGLYIKAKLPITVCIHFSVENES